MMLLPWSARDKAILIEMWQAGASAVAIAHKLGNGRTRNSILGFVFRLRRKNPEIQLRNENMRRMPNPDEINIVRTKPQPKKKEQPIAQVNLFTPIAEEPAPHGGVPYFETRLFQCKYILNTSKDTHNIKCCGGVVYRTTSWCRKHYNEVFIGRISPETQVGHLSSGKIQVASKFQFRRM